MVEHVLAPIDGSDNAERALRFAAQLAARFDAEIDVVHLTDVETEATEALLDSAREILEAAEVEAELSIEYDLRLTFRGGDRIGDDILEIAEEGGYDHVVMGHHGSGTVERLVMGSATETVIRANEVAVTVIP